MAISLAIVLRVTFIGILMTQSSPRGIDTTGVWLVLLACAAFWTLLAISLWWFYPARVADDFPSEARTPVVSRRLLFTGIGIAGLAVLSQGFLRRFERDVRLLFLTPRFVHKKPLKRRPLSAGFYEARKDRRIYASDGKVFSRPLRKVPASDLIKVSLDRMSAKDLPRVHPGSLLAWLHGMIHREIGSGRVDAACELLVSALALDHIWRRKAGRKANLQLYDLVASVSRDLDSKETLTKVTALAKEVAVDTSFPYDRNARRITEELRERVEKWSDPASPWSLKRAVSSKERSSPLGGRDVRSNRTRLFPPLPPV